MTAETMTALPAADAAERLDTASQWQLMRWCFLRHKAAVVSLFVIAFFYATAIAVEFVAPYDPNIPNVFYQYAPPMRIRILHEGRLHRPFTYDYVQSRDPQTLRMVFAEDEEQPHPIRFWVKGDPYRFWGLWRGDRHLFGLEDPDARIFLLGTDELGRDMLSRVVYGTRISLSIGFIGVILSLALGVLLGGISGYFGGTVDLFIQRMIELLQSLPQIPLWLTLSAALPREWSAIQIYFGITIVISVVAWTEIARVVRGRFLALREEEFVLAARFLGASETRIIFRHLVPSMTSHLIAVLTLRIPEMILAETALSFIGLGLQAPVVSWGVLLADVQNIRTVASSPWLFSTGVCIIVVVLCFNFTGDGLRDAADPYTH